MSLERAFVQQRDGSDWISTACYACAYAFRERGVEVVPFTYAEMLGGTLDISKETVVSGGVQAVRAALRQLDLEEPENIDLPESLNRFWGREVCVSTMGAVRQIERYDPPIHVKPLHGHKAFTGTLLKRRDDLLGLTSVPSELGVLVQECVNFVSEFRFYVLHSQVVGVGYYAGDPLVLPEPFRVRAMVNEFVDAPVAYGLDVGVDDQGKTLLVEVNDAFALGFYGINPFRYAEMVEARWGQLVASAR